jgi:hypothetical protein
MKIKPKLPLHRAWGLKSKKSPGKSESWRKVLRVFLPPLVYHAVRILGKSSGSFLPSTLPRDRRELVRFSPGVKKYKMIMK